MFETAFLYLSAALDASLPHSHAAAKQVPFGDTLLFTLLLVMLIAALALEEKLHAKKSVVVGLFAVVSLILGAVMGLLDFGPVTLPNGHLVHLPVYIPHIEWGVVSIILGSSIFVDVTSKSGLFTWIAIKMTKASRGDPLYLLAYYGVMTVVFSAVLNNVTAMIIIGSLSAVSLSKLQRQDKLLGFLLVEGLLTNIGGLLTLISSVPNIIVGSTAGIGFVSFFIKAAPYVIVASAATLWMGARAFHIQRLKGDDEKKQARGQIELFDENDGIDSRGLFWFSLVMLLLFIVFIASASFEGWAIGQLGMGFVAMSFGVIMLLAYRSEATRFYAAVDWDLLLFFVFLFVTLSVMEAAKVLDLIGLGVAPIISLGKYLGGGLLLLASALASSVTDNIPLSAMLAKILSSSSFATPKDSALWWSVIFGANLGGNLTPIGSASTLVAVTIMHKHELPISFMGFVKKALPFAALHIALATVYVLVFLT